MRPSGHVDAPIILVCVNVEGQRRRVDVADRVLSFEYTDSEEKADQCILTVDNFDLSFLDDDLFRKGNLMEVSWGYPQNLSPTRTVVIQRVRGFTQLKIEGHAKSVLLNKDTKCRTFENLTRSEVAQKIAETNGFKPKNQDIENTQERLAFITQAKLTDAQFMKRLAQKEGFEFFVDFDGFHFHRRRLGQKPQMSFTYYTDRVGEIISISMDSDLSAKPGAVSLKGRDPIKKTEICERASNATSSRASLGEAIEILDRDSVQFRSDQNNASESVLPTPNPSSSDTKCEAAARQRKGQHSAIKMTMQIAPQKDRPILLAKTIIELRGLGQRFSGNYYVPEVKTRNDQSGYKVAVKMLRDGTSEVGRTTTQGDVNKGRAEDNETDRLSAVERFDPRTGSFSHVEYVDRRGRAVGVKDSSTGLSRPVK